MDRELIELYLDGGRKLSKAVAGLDEADLVAFPIPGTWSIKQLVAHVVDADLVLSDRMKRIIAEDRPTLLAFDENKWMEQLHYQLQSVPDLLVLLDANRRAVAAVLRLLPPEAFARFGIHSEAGEQSLETVLGKSVKHLDHHLKFLYDKREKLGKLMW